MKPARHLLLWDGDCGFCARCAGWLQAQDSKQLFEIAPHQSKSETFLAQYELDHERCSQEIKLITSNQKVLGGAEAVNFFFEKYFPWSLFAKTAQRLPPLLAMEKWAYRTVSRNRKMLSKLLGVKTCAR